MGSGYRLRPTAEGRLQKPGTEGGSRLPAFPPRTDTGHQPSGVVVADLGSARKDSLATRVHHRPLLVQLLLVTGDQAFVPLLLCRDPDVHWSPSVNWEDTESNGSEVHRVVHTPRKAPWLQCRRELWASSGGRGWGVWGQKGRGLGPGWSPDTPVAPSGQRTLRDY